MNIIYDLFWLRPFTTHVVTIIHNAPITLTCKLRKVIALTEPFTICVINEVILMRYVNIHPLFSYSFSTYNIHLMSC